MLFAPKDFITQRIHDTVAAAKGTSHILNLGHGVFPDTPEENVAHFFEVARSLSQ